MRIKIALAAIATLCAVQAKAEWLKLSTSSNGDVWLIDPTRMKSLGGRKFEVWIKMDHSRNRSISYRTSLNLFGINCSSQKYKLLSYVNYDSYGKVVSSHTFTEYGYEIGYEPIIPETMVESISNAVCVGTD